MIKRFLNNSVSGESGNMTFQPRKSLTGPCRNSLNLSGGDGRPGADERSGFKPSVELCTGRLDSPQRLDAEPTRSICSNSEYKIKARSIAKRSEVAVSRE